jgi:transposase
LESQANSATIICWSRVSFWFFLYKLRHLVGNCFLALKRWRGIATGYAKTSDAFIAALHVRRIAIWAAIRA